MAVEVVPPHSPTTAPRGTSALAARGDPLLLLGVLLVLVAQRQVVGDRVPDRAAARAGEQLLLGEGVEVASRGRGRHVELGDDVVDVDLAALGEQVEHGVEAFCAIHSLDPYARRDREQTEQSGGLIHHRLAPAREVRARVDGRRMLGEVVPDGRA